MKSSSALTTTLLLTTIMFSTAGRADVLGDTPDDPTTATRTKQPSRSGANDITTATTDTIEITTPSFTQPRIYWGDVGSKDGYSLNRVLELAWQANPNWQVYAANHAAAHAALVEACAFPNPELDFEYGSERSDGAGRRSIWTLGVSQPIELPGKRAARQAEALAGFPVVQGEQLEYAGTLRAAVREAYWTVQYHAAREQMYSTQISITRKQYNLAEERQKLGDAGRIEITNARLELMKSEREQEVSKRRKQGAMAALNALAGGRLGQGFTLSENFPRTYGRPQLDISIQQALSTHPRLVRLAAELEHKYAGIQRQRREWWPDVKLGGRRSKEFDGDSAAVTAAIEIPLWNRNQGGVARAEADAQKVYAQIGVAYNELRRDVEVSYQNLMVAREEIASYEDGLKEVSEEAVNLAWEQLNLGGGSYIDILVARRQLVETQQAYIQALYDAATARARFLQAMGQ